MCSTISPSHSSFVASSSLKFGFESTWNQKTLSSFEGDALTQFVLILCSFPTRSPLESPFHLASSSAEQTLWMGMLAYGGMASGIAMVREIAKDAQDIEGDLAAGKTTFPARYGKQAARWTCLALLLLIGLAYGTALSTMDLESGAASLLQWSVPAVGWSWALLLLTGSETRWDRVSTATLLTLLLGSLQCLWIDGF